MNIKLIVSVVLIGGVLVFFGVKPTDLLNQGGQVWENFSGDFMAIFSGETTEKVAKEIRGNAGAVVQVAHDAASAEGEEENTIEKEILRDRKEWAKSTKVTDLNPEELKQRLKEIKMEQE